MTPTARLYLREFSLGLVFVALAYVLLVFVCAL